VRNYHGDVERLDRCVAAVLGVLDKRGLADTTLVAFTSDNGADFPFAKGTLHEAGVNMPLLVRWPGRVAAGAVHDGLVSFIDLLPTFMEAFGLAPPGDIDGRSFLPLLLGGTAVHREAIFCEHDEHKGEVAIPSRAVIEARYKYVRHFRLDKPFENDAMRTFAWAAMQRAALEDPALEVRMRRMSERPRAELFDLAQDPWELVDQAGDPALAEVEAGLAERLRSWMSEQGDALLDEWDA
jgi:arylsulfatase A-like enzyme